MLQEILGRVQEINAATRRSGSVAIWYRGQRKSCWELKLTLHRYVERLTGELVTPLTLEEKKSWLREEGKTIYRRFKAESWPLLGDAERSDWGVPFTMQHYRLPMRLLDWTESFACALFFAQQHREPGDAGAVWVLDSERLNEVSIGQRGLIALDENIDEGTIDLRRWHPRRVPPPEDLPTIAVTPIFTNPRMTAHELAFTASGDSFLPCTKILREDLMTEGIVVKIELPPVGFDEVQAYPQMNWAASLHLLSRSRRFGTRPRGAGQVNVARCTQVISRILEIRIG